MIQIMIQIYDNEQVELCINYVNYLEDKFTGVAEHKNKYMPEILQVILPQSKI